MSELPHLEHNIWSCSELPRGVDGFSVRVLREYKRFAFPAQFFEDAFGQCDTDGFEKWAKFEPLAIYHVLSQNGLLHYLSTIEDSSLPKEGELQSFRDFLLPSETIAANPQFSLELADHWVMPDAFQLYRLSKRYRLSDTPLGRSSTADIEPSTPIRSSGLVHSNRALDRPEIESINAILTQDTVQILELDHKLEDAKDAVERLRRQREHLQAHRAQHRQMLSPIWRLPLEMLGEVFRHCIPDSLEGLRPSVVMSLTHVCRRWRNAGLQTPCLWTRVVLGTYGTRNTHANSQLSLAKLWLSRAGKLPITLKLYNSMMDGCRVGTDALISQYIDQLEYLELDNEALFTMSDAHRHYPQLHTLVLSGLGVFIEEPLDFIEVAPELRTLRLAFHITPGNLILPWSQLTELSLTLEDYGVDECLRLLQLAPNVKKCQLKMETEASSDYGTEEICVHMLQSLVVTTRTGMEQFFLHAQFPALTDLDIFIDENGCWAPQELEGLFIRSACPLKRLKLAGLEDDDVLSDHEGSLLGCLEQVPSLVELILPTPNPSIALNEELLLRLTEGSSISNPFLPNLQILRFHHDMLGSECYIALARMLQSRIDTIQEGRRHDVCQLRTVEIMSVHDVVHDSPKHGFLLKTLRQQTDESVDIYASDIIGDKISLQVFDT